MAVEQDLKGISRKVLGGTKTYKKEKKIRVPENKNYRKADPFLKEIEKLKKTRNPENQKTIKSEN